MASQCWPRRSSEELRVDEPPDVDCLPEEGGRATHTGGAADQQGNCRGVDVREADWIVCAKPASFPSSARCCAPGVVGAKAATRCSTR